MLSLPTKHQIDRGGFTLVEMVISLAVLGVVFLILVSVLVTTMKLSIENADTNMSNYRVRQALDRLDEIVRYAQDTPTLINNDGTAATGTTADGLLINNVQGSVYVFYNADGNVAHDIPTGASTFVVKYTTVGVDASKVADYLPKVGDYFSLNISTHPNLEVTGVSAATSGNPLNSVTITTKTGITETVTPSTYEVNAARYRKEAYVFVADGSTGYFALRHYGRVKSSTVYSDSNNYHQVSTGFSKMTNQTWFTAVTDGSAQAVWVRAITRTSNHAEYAERISGHNTFTTMPLQVKLWNYDGPTPNPY